MKVVYVDDASLMLLVGQLYFSTVAIMGWWCLGDCESLFSAAPGSAGGGSAGGGGGAGREVRHLLTP